MSARKPIAMLITDTDSPMALLPCPLCGDFNIMVRENRTNNAPRMDGKRWPVFTVQIDHNCPRETDANGNYSVLAAGVHVRGCDHASAEQAWNRRAPAPCNPPQDHRDE